MGWPRSNEGLRLYYERSSKSYLLYDPDDSFGIGEVLIDNDPESPKLATTGVSPLYIHNNCKRVEWSEMPEIWQEAFRGWLNEEPEEYRGFWRIKHEAHK